MALALAIIGLAVGIALGLLFKVLVLVPAIALAVIFALIVGLARSDSFTLEYDDESRHSCVRAAIPATPLSVQIKRTGASPRLREWSQSPAAIGDGRSGPCPRNGERVKKNGSLRHRSRCDGISHDRRLAPELALFLFRLIEEMKSQQVRVIPP
jgi:hypothetical protein